jgi:uncharacterized glyoxalase superfamily protein PhnB
VATGWIFAKEPITIMKSIVPALAVASIEKSVEFYTQVLGFDILFTLPGADGSLVHASVGRGEASVMFGKLDPSNPHDQGKLGAGVALYATVADNEDIDAYFRRVKDAGATVVQVPKDEFWGHRDWIIADPDGYLLWIGKPTRDVSAEEMQEAMMAGAPA